MTRKPDTGAIEIIDLAGDAYTRGKAFGAVRQQQIQLYISDWLESLRTAGIADPQTYIAGMLSDTDFLPAIHAHAPELLDEVRGIASGAKQPQDIVLAAQLMDEEWAYRPSFLSRAEALQKCSAVAIRARKGTTWIGQNMDLGGYTDGHQILLRLAPHASEPGALIFTIGGMIGLLGVNARGVGVCVNSLPQLPSAPHGLPVAFVIRKLLKAQSVAEAVQMVHAVRHATGQHYLIADSTSIRSFEASPAGVLEYRSPDASRVLHTNHPLAEDKQAAANASDQTNTVARLRSLTQRLMIGEPDLDAIKAALSSSDNPEHPICRVPTAHGAVHSAASTICFTTGSMISALQQDSQTVDSWVSAGPPSLRGYTQVHLSTNS